MESIDQIEKGSVDEVPSELQSNKDVSLDSCFFGIDAQKQLDVSNLSILLGHTPYIPKINGSEEKINSLTIFTKNPRRQLLVITTSSVKDGETYIERIRLGKKKMTQEQFIKAILAIDTDKL